jgi:GNAT superfamily N-acetyltransferase
MDVTIEPVTPERWEDLVAVFGLRGDPARCWCAYLRQATVDYRDRDGNRDRLRAAVDSGSPPGVLAYSEGSPVGWASVAPREEFAARLARSAALRPVPGDGVWSVLCFVVPRSHRGQGVAHALLRGAVLHARSHGAKAVEGVPRDDRGGKRWANPVAYTGTASMFERAGFTEIDRRRDGRVVYRRDL